MTPEDAPATKRDLTDLEGRLSQRMDSLETRMVSMEDRMLGRMRDMFLGAFLPFQEQSQVRDKTLEVRQAALETRFSSVEGRLAQIEKKLLLEPPAA